ncbi:MAG: hypothetical protein ACYC25_08950, partial [Paludibacter sp.]
MNEDFASSLLSLMDKPMRFTALDFFAGSGLVTEGLSPCFDTIWANDLCPKKMAVYAANFRKNHFLLKPIQEVSGS